MPKVKTDTWIPVSTRLPKEEINPITDDYCEYMVTVELSGGRRDIRYYKFGDGHWWHFGQCMDKYVVAWKERGTPWEDEDKINNKTDKQETKMELEMPYGKVVITTPEEAIYFIKNACNKCPRYYICSGNKAKKCINKKQAAIDAFFNTEG